MSVYYIYKVKTSNPECPTLETLSNLYSNYIIHAFSVTGENTDGIIISKTDLFKELNNSEYNDLKEKLIYEGVFKNVLLNKTIYLSYPSQYIIYEIPFKGHYFKDCYKNILDLKVELVQNNVYSELYNNLKKGYLVAKGVFIDDIRYIGEILEKSGFNEYTVYVSFWDFAKKSDRYDTEEEQILELY